MLLLRRRSATSNITSCHKLSHSVTASWTSFDRLGNAINASHQYGCLNEVAILSHCMTDKMADSVIHGYDIIQ